jgi:hypothetical protein
LCLIIPFFCLKTNGMAMATTALQASIYTLTFECIEDR